MADKLLIVILNTDPDNPQEPGAPFFQAMVAAAMEYEVEVILTGRAGELAFKDVAAAIQVTGQEHKTVYDIIQDAHRAGVVFKVCAPALQQGQEMQTLIPEIEETVGAAYLISAAMDDDTVTFTY